MLFRRELALAWSGGGGPLLALGFYAAIATLVPLATGPAPQRLAPIAGGLAWVALALASLLSLERMFERDFEDGALDLLALGPAAAGGGRGGQVPGPLDGGRRAAGAGRADRRRGAGRAALGWPR